MLFISIKLKNSMKKSTFYIVGKHAVTEALKNPNRKVLRVFLTEDAEKKINKENDNLNLLKKYQIFFINQKKNWINIV